MRFGAASVGTSDMSDPGTNGAAGQATKAPLSAVERAGAYDAHVRACVQDAKGRISIAQHSFQLSAKDAFDGWLEAVRQVATDNGVVMSTTRPRRKR